MPGPAESLLLLVMIGIPLAAFIGLGWLVWRSICGSRDNKKDD